MLQYCFAIVFSDAPHNNAALTAAVRAAGFGAIIGADEVQTRDAIGFFFVDCDLGEQHQQAVLKEIRSDPRVRFFPVIAATLGTDLPLDHYARAGFDDVIDFSSRASGTAALEAQLSGEARLLPDLDLFRPRPSAPGTGADT